MSHNRRRNAGKGAGVDSGATGRAPCAAPPTVESTPDAAIRHRKRKPKRRIPHRRLRLRTPDRWRLRPPGRWRTRP
eukprot:8462748-Alexandrium_andersonii.AAC.1